MIDQIPVYVQNNMEAQKPIVKKIVKQEEPEPVEPVQVVEEPAVVSEPEEEPVKVKEEPSVTETKDVFDFSNFIVDSADFQPPMQHKHRSDLKFGEDYDISKDK